MVQMREIQHHQTSSPAKGNYNLLAGIPVEGKSSMCLICMKYRIIILIIIIISLGQIFLSYIANTTRTHVRAHGHTAVAAVQVTASLFGGAQP